MKTAIFTARLTPAEREALAEIARQHDLTPAGWIRSVIHQFSGILDLDGDLLHRLRVEGIGMPRRRRSAAQKEKAADS